jgi:N-methylhydantoinase A
VLTPLCEDDVREAARKFKARGTEAVAISYLNSFMNPCNEVRTKEILEEEQPDDVYVYASADALPEIREFERTSTTVASAYLAPIINHYLDAFVSRICEWGYEGEVGVTHSGGDTVSTRAARSVPARICQSGPAGGVIGGLVTGKAPDTKTSSPSTWAGRAQTFRSWRRARRRSSRSRGWTGTSRSSSPRSIS